MDGSHPRARRPPFNLSAIAKTERLIAAGLEPVALKDDALRHCRAFVADLQSEADTEARDLLRLIDRALGSRT